MPGFFNYYFVPPGGKRLISHSEETIAFFSLRPLFFPGEQGRKYDTAIKFQLSGLYVAFPYIVTI
jgi:hypothetical protein